MRKQFICFLVIRYSAINTDSATDAGRTGIIVDTDGNPEYHNESEYSFDDTPPLDLSGDDTAYDYSTYDDDWGATRQKYNLSGDEMFEYFNKPVLDEALSSCKTIRFSHNPIGVKGYLGSEWNYIKTSTGLTDANLIFEGGFWYVRLK